MSVNFIFFNKKKLFFNKSVKPTKNIVRKQFLSWIILFINKLYVIDFFCGSCVFGFEFYHYKTKKILNFDINCSNIHNILSSLIDFNILISDKFLLYETNSFDWINNINLFNFSLIIFDPPYLFYNIIKFLIEISRIKFLRTCLFLFFETNCYFNLKYLSYDFFVIKKNVMGNVHFFLLKKI